jgi:hypothetical protein
VTQATLDAIAASLMVFGVATVVLILSRGFSDLIRRSF